MWSKLFIQQKNGIAGILGLFCFLETLKDIYLCTSSHNWLVEYLTVVLVENQSGETMIFD